MTLTQLENLSKEELIEIIKQQEHIRQSRLTTTLRLLMDNTSDMMLWLNSQFRIIAFNNAYAKHIQKLYNKPISEGQLISDILPQESFQYWQQYFHECTSHAKRIEVTHHLLSNGKPYIVSVTMTPYIDISGNTDGAVIYLKDITEQAIIEQKLRRSEARFRAIMSYTSDIIALIDAQGETKFVTPSFFRITGYDELDSSIRNVFTLVHPEDLPIAKAEMQRMLAGDIKNIPLEIRIKKQDGSYIYLEIIAQNKLDDENIKGIIINGRNITNRKKAEAELIQARQAAEEALKIKDNFLSVMSHEIRTPLTAVIGMANMLLQDHPSEHQIDYLRTLNTSADHLLALINDILDFSKIQAGKLVFESAPFHLPTLIENVCNIHSLTAAEKGLVLNYKLSEAIPAWLVGDSLRLSQILHNLLSNAIKFTPTGSVEVRATISGQHDERILLQITVADTGIGIPPDQIEHIFELFTQVQNNTTRKYGGTGLGLAITKHLVEMQGGSIWVESQPQKGSVFSLVIPYTIACEVPQHIQQPSSVPEDALFNKKILYIDDIPVNQSILKNFSKIWKTNLTTASSGKEALQQIEQQQSQGQYFDLIITDILMPEMDGYQVAAQIRQHPDSRLACTPIIALTADVSTSVEQKAKSVGIDVCLNKPIDQHALRRQIIALLFEQNTNATKISSSVQQETATLKPDFITDNDAFIEFLQLARQQVEQAAENIHKAFVNADEESLRKEIHAIKPMLAYMHQDELIKQLQHLRTTVNTGSIEERLMAAMKVGNIMEKLYRRIENQLQILQTSSC